MTKLLLTIAIVTLISPAIWAGPVTNGGFETGDFTGWSLGGGCNGLGINGGGAPCWAYVDSTAPNGPFDSYSAIMGPQPDAGTLDQMITVAPGTWTVSFELEVSTGTPPGNGIFNPPNFFDVSWGGTEVLGLTNLPAEGWTLETVNVVSTGAPTDLMFSFRQDISGNFWLDQVNMTSAGVPEPGTVALFGLGLGLLSLARLRRTKR